jgi:hypothetical protein
MSSSWMQIKTTLRFHPTPIRMAIKNTKGIVGKDFLKKKEPSYTVCGKVN